MQVQVDITRTDFLEFNKFVLLRNRLKRSFGIATFFVLLWLILLNKDRPFNFLLIVIQLVIFYLFWAAFILLTYFYTTWKIKKYPDDNGSLLGRKKYIIQEDGFKEETDTSQTLTKWGGVKKIAENKDYVFVFVDKIAAYIVPKRHFASEIEKNEFVETLKLKTKK